MGFNKKYLPPVADLIKIRERMASDERFLDIYFYKPDAIIGSTESVEYLDDLSKQIQNKISEDEF
jgi:hypothetical protein